MGPGLMGLTFRVTTRLRRRNHSPELSEIKPAAGAYAGLVRVVVQPEDLDSVELGNERVVLELPDAARHFLLSVASAEPERGSAERERKRAASRSAVVAEPQEPCDAPPAGCRDRPLALPRYSTGTAPYLR